MSTSLVHPVESIAEVDAVLSGLATEDVDSQFALSYGQQRLWFLQQLEPESAAYNIRVAVRLRGELKVGALTASLNEIVRRHESLRTRFAVVAGEPVQLIDEAADCGLELVDLQGLEASEREGEAERQARAEGERAFNLEAGPLLRVRLLQLGAAEHVLLLTLHHIISDGWSLGVLFKELGRLYEAYGRGAESPLAELAVQYGDYASWQREQLQGEVLAEQMSYWQEQLRGAPALLELPLDRPRPALQSYAGRRQRVELSRELTRALKELSRGEGVTLFMTLLAAFQVLLARYTGQQDIVVGTPVAGRNRVEVEGLIGFFLNTLPLRTELRGQPSFRELLQRVKHVCLQAYAHQDLPFE
ncbi:MAG: condensation domain-containing protein, partial [Pyrinomonadaceae bacterium]